MLLSLFFLASAQDIPFERYELPNGLQVILHQDHTLPMVVVDLWYGVGSKEEAAGRSGFAHLFEHLMFMGTNRLPDNGFDVSMEAAGGWNNAWTMEDATNYYEVGPPNLLPTFLWMEADRMEQLGQAMTQEKLDLQRDVVRNERRQSYEDQPYGEVWLKLPELLYPAGHPYAHTVIGTHEDLQNATLQDVKDFFATWYVPNNASLVVAGDFDPAEIKPVIAQYFGHIPMRPLPERAAPPVPTAPQVKDLTLEDDVPVPQLNLFFHAPAAYAEGEAELSLVASLLGEGESSRLYRRLVLEGLAQDVVVYNSPTMLGSVFFIQATAMEGVGIDKIEAAIWSELDRLSTETPEAHEMERLKNQFEYAFLVGLEDLQARAEQLNNYDAYTGSPDYLQKDLARYRGATAEGITAVTSSYLTRDKAARVVVVPKDGE